MRTGNTWKLVVRFIAVITAAPFVIAVLLLWEKALRAAGPFWSRLLSPTLLSTSLIALGMALGIIGSAFALTCSLDQPRLRWTSLTLLAASLIVFGFLLWCAIAHMTLHSKVAPIALSTLGAILMAWSSILMLRSFGYAQAQNVQQSDDNASVELQ
jgi:hypothetical protein